MPIQYADYSNITHEELAEAIGLKIKHIPLLLNSFVEESINIINGLENAINGRDYASIRTHSHSIKGSAGTLQFNEIYQMTKEMEFAATDSSECFDYKGHLKAVKLAIATIPNQVSL